MVFANDEESPHLCRVAVFVMSAHKPPSELEARVRQYLTLDGNGVKLNRFLGEGTDGAVWATNRDTAVKVYLRERGYGNEWATYELLAKLGVTDSIDGFWVPQMQSFDDQLMVVEMDMMHDPPYIIDFAKVRLYSSPEFSEETLADNDRQGHELFDDNWPAVVSLMSHLESMGIYYLDPKPHNIVFPGWPRR